MHHHKKNFSYARYGYFFIIPFVVIFLIFSLYPLVYTIAISFSDMAGTRTPGREYGILTRTITDYIPVQAVDAYNEGLYDENGEVVYYKFESEKVYERDAFFSPVVDENGDFIYHVEFFLVFQAVDYAGEPVLNESEESITHKFEVDLISETEESGDYIFYNADGEAVYRVVIDKTFEEYEIAPVENILSRPKLDEYGQPITELDLLGNYRTVLGMTTFQRAIGTTFKIWTINFIPQILLAVVLAVWFTSRWTKIKGQGLFKMLFYMPNIITAGSIAMLFSTLFMFPIGVVNNFLMTIGVIDAAYNFSVDATATQLIVSFIQFWMWYGYTMLIVISGIIGLNPQMYESADIDGAGPVKQFFYITLPNLRTILLFIFVTSVIGGMNMFDIPMLYSDGGPTGATTTTSIAIFQQAFAGSRRYNTAAAMSVIMFFIIAAFSIMLFFIMRDKDEIKLKKFKKAEARAKKQAMKEAR
jgi:multiple sugar transport system permease protein